MKTGFKDALEVKEGKKMKSPWNFDCPHYDQRSSSFVGAGSDYGVGRRSPVGRSGDAKPTSPSLPMGKVDTMKVEDLPFRKMQVSPDEKE